VGTFNNKKLKNIETKRFAFGIITLLTFVVSIFVTIVMILNKGFYNSFLAIALIVILNITVILRYYPYFKNKMELRDIDKKIYMLSYSFLIYLNYENKEERLKRLFSAHLDSDIIALYIKCSVNKINYVTVCKELLNYKVDVKYFALYTLLDISSEDNFYSLHEEEFINDVRRLLKVHKTSFDSIKNSYIKRGLKEERKILEDETRKKTTKELTKTFLPYNAYKILGISPSISKRELKKVYRTLAKKYHPDKFNNQSDKTIKEMEEKFQEITEAYEIVKRYKKY